MVLSKVLETKMKRMDILEDKELPKLPEIAGQPKVVALAKNCEKNPNSDSDNVNSAVGILPKISMQKGERIVTFNTGNREDSATRKSNKQFSVKLPVVDEVPSNETKSECVENKLVQEERKMWKQMHQEEDNRRGIASGTKYEEANNISNMHSTDFSRMSRNADLQRDLVFMHYSQTISRCPYSYFKRFPSPIPLSSKKEKLRQKMAANMPKKPPEKKPQPGELRSKDEYAGIINSVKDVQTKFTKRHKLLKPTKTPLL